MERKQPEPEPEQREEEQERERKQERSGISGVARTAISAAKIGLAWRGLEALAAAVEDVLYTVRFAAEAGSQGARAAGQAVQHGALAHVGVVAMRMFADASRTLPFLLT